MNASRMIREELRKAALQKELAMKEMTLSPVFLESPRCLEKKTNKLMNKSKQLVSSSHWQPQMAIAVQKSSGKHFRCYTSRFRLVLNFSYKLLQLRCLKKVLLTLELSGSWKRTNEWLKSVEVHQKNDFFGLYPSLLFIFHTNWYSWKTGQRKFFRETRVL